MKNTPRFAAACLACTAALGSLKAKQIESFVRLTLALANNPHIDPTLGKTANKQVNWLFQMGLFQHDFDTPLSADQDQWCKTVLMYWLNALTDALKEDYDEFHAKAKAAAETGIPDELAKVLEALFDAVKPT